MSAADPAPEELVARWDHQQAAYITKREERFEIMLDVLVRMVSRSPRFGDDGEGCTVLDVACGPGSLSARILERLPGACVLGVDYDPVLLSIAATSLGRRFGARFEAIDADLATPRWTEGLPHGEVDAAVSSTALHWLEPGELVTLYGVLGGLIAEDGVFMNADHLRYSASAQPFLTEISEFDDDRTQRAEHEAGAPTWDEWWAEAIATPELGRLQAERERRFADRPPTPHAPLELHLQALRTGGFREVGTIWRHYDDVVLFGRR